MKGRILNIVLVLVLATLPMAANAGWSEAQQVTDQTLPAPVTVEQTPALDEDFKSSRVMFIENAGQWDDGARFQVWGGPVGTMWLAEDAIWITVVEPGETSRQVDKGFDPGAPFEDREDTAPRRGVNIKLSFVGANPHPRIETFDRLDTAVSYFIGNDPDQWRPDVPVWGGVRYVDLYPGIDLEIVSKDGRMVQRLVTRPGADLSAVQLRVEGADGVATHLDWLWMSTAAGDYAMPLVQATGSSGAPAVQAREEQVFDVSAPLAAGPPTNQSPQFAPDSPLDNPADLIYGTFLGGSDYDSGQAIAVDGSGSAFVTGYTSSSDFPTTPGAFNTNYNWRDVFVVKLNLGGSALAYATFLGGSGDDQGLGIHVDGSGRAYVTGQTNSTNFPTTPGAFDTSHNGDFDAFVAKLNQVGSGLTYATYLGGGAWEAGYGIAVVDAEGSAYVTGWANALFPTTSGAFDTSHNGNWDAFVAKLNSAGSALTYATYLGGSERDYGTDIAVDGTGSAYITGYTFSINFPTSPGAFDTDFNSGNDNGPDAFVAKLNPAGSLLSYATFLGGTRWDYGHSIAVDGSGSAFVTGETNSPDFPVTSGAFDTSHNGLQDAFVVKLNSTGAALMYATFLGGGSTDSGNGIAVDGTGNAYVTGSAGPTGFPTTPGAFDTSHNGGYYDAFTAKLNPAGSSLAYATYLGGNSWDGGKGIAVDSGGSVYVAGGTGSANFPTTPGSFDTSHNGIDDTFVAKVAMGGSGTPGDYTISGRVTTSSGTGLGGVTISDNAGHTTVTNSNGNYTLSGISQGTYIITPSRSGYAFNPTSRSVSVPPSASGIDFQGSTSGSTYSISGRVTTSSGAGIEGVTISDNAGHSTVTNSNGNYTLSGLSQGTYTITPSRSGYTFSPASRSVSVPPSASNIDFQGSTSSSTYSISGRVTAVNGPGVAGVTIHDNAGHSTVTNASGYYTLSGLSARTYTITPSKGGYTFGPASQTVSVPPSRGGINFTGYDKLPIVFVHGWNGTSSSCDWVNPSTYFYELDDAMFSAGYHVEYARLESSKCFTPPIRENARRLDNAIQQAKATTNRSQVILVTHSMGGLVARAYIEGDAYDRDVARVFTLGSPHRGVPTEILLILAGPALGPSLATYCLRQQAVCEFSTPGMVLFNQRYANRRNGVTYHVVSGAAPRDASSRSPGALWIGRAYWGLGISSDDGLVGTYSGLGLSNVYDSWSTQETHGSGSGPRNYFHWNGNSQATQSYRQCLEPILVSRTSQRCRSTGVSEVMAMDQSSLSGSTPIIYDTLVPGQAATYPTVIEGGEALFAAQWVTGTVQLSLIDPSGRVIDPAYAAANPDEVTYSSSLGSATYEFSDALGGTWQIQLQAVDVPASGSQTMISAFFESSQALLAGVDKLWQRPGNTAMITVTLSPSPQSASVVATILLADATSAAVTLTSQGGGRYRADYLVPAAPGYAEVRLVAAGVNSGGSAFEQGTSLVFQISPDTVALNGSYSDTPEPRWPGASIYQALNVSVGVNVNTTGSYGLSAELVDAAGNPVAHSNVISDLTSGAQTLTLRFDGADIYESQRNGPYRLTDLLLTDHNGATLVVQEAQNVYITAAYRYRDFRTGDLFLPVIMR